MGDPWVGVSEGRKWKNCYHKEFQTNCLLSSESSDPNESLTLSPSRGQDYSHFWPSVFVAGFACELVIDTQELGMAILG